MNLRRFLSIAIVAVVFSFAANSNAHAQFGIGGAGGNGFFGGLGAGYYRHPYRWGRVPTPPYFALHPPVYYGQQYRRPYGVSPFACRNCQVQPNKEYRPTKAAVSPLVILNPHVKPKVVPKTEKKTTLASYPKPLLILNPYVQQAEVARKP